MRTVVKVILALAAAYLIAGAAWSILMYALVGAHPNALLPFTFAEGGLAAPLGSIEATLLAAVRVVRVLLLLSPELIVVAVCVLVWLRLRSRNQPQPEDDALLTRIQRMLRRLEDRIRRLEASIMRS